LIGAVNWHEKYLWHALRYRLARVVTAPIKVDFVSEVLDEAIASNGGASEGWAMGLLGRQASQDAFRRRRAWYVSAVYGADSGGVRESIP
jgi:hypothetical protein